MQNDYDVIVIGLGAMGGAAMAHLARMHLRVLGLDRFHPPHNFGSSHGSTRIIREAYFEHPSYVPLVQRAYELWADLTHECFRRLFWRTGGLMLGAPDGVLVTGARRSAEQHNLPHKILSAAEIRQQFPAIDPADDMVGVWEPRAGVLFPELAIQTQLELSAMDGAVLRFDEPVLKWEPLGEGVLVHTAVASYRARRLLLSVGAWMTSLVPELHLPLTVERQVLLWFEPASDFEFFHPERCPIYICEYAPRRFFYGFPDVGDGVKLGVHHEGRPADPDNVDRTVTEEEIEIGRGLLSRFLPRAAGGLKSSAVCIYTNTPDENFILDLHPQHPQVVIASPCSGHGFKFSPVIGEIASMLLTDKKPPFDLSLFRLARFPTRTSAQR